MVIGFSFASLSCFEKWALNWNLSISFVKLTIDGDIIIYLEYISVVKLEHNLSDLRLLLRVGSSVIKELMLLGVHSNTCI